MAKTPTEMVATIDDLIAGARTRNQTKINQIIQELGLASMHQSTIDPDCYILISSTGAVQMVKEPALKTMLQTMHMDMEM